MNPNLPILGVEIDPERVESARPFADELTHFRLGGFNLPLQAGESVRLIRAFNVLRQYEEKEFIPAYERHAEHVLPGGLMIEGTSNPFGSIWVANVARRADVTLRERSDRRVSDTDSERSFASLRMTNESWRMEALVFSTNLRKGFDITDFRAVLPKNHIHHVVPGEPIHDFMEAWKRAAAETAHMKAFGLRQWFVSSVESLAQKGYKINLHRKFLSKGWLIWEL